MKIVQLTQGKVALVDDADYERLMQFSWSAFINCGKWYAQAWHTGKRTNISMHRLVMNAEKGQQIDHADGDGLNNQRKNLRFASSMQNAQNRKCYNAWGFKGVHRDARCKARPWFATICINKQFTHLGYFATAEDAARAYDAAALEHFGEFARLNFSQAAVA